MHGPIRLGLLAVWLAFLADVGAKTLADLDMWHEMALFREVLRLGRFPADDPFTYTSTIRPVVHHEWGAGAILYAVAMTAGGGGIIALKFLLAAGVLSLALLAARRRGASWPVLLSTAPLVVGPIGLGFATLRAQAFTMCFLAFEMYLLARDEKGGRRWPWWLLPVVALWLNLHAGFVVGAGLLACHALEQAVRRQPCRHLVLIGLLIPPLLLLHPFGWQYVGYLAHGLFLPRPLIPEWQPIWRQDEGIVAGYLLLVGAMALALAVRQPARATGWLMVLVCAFAATRHARHLPLFAIVWLCVVPAWIEPTPIGELIRRLWRNRGRFVAFLWCVMLLASGLLLAKCRFWELRVPGESPSNTGFVYPTGVVEYLRRNRFAGNLMTTYETGSYVSYRLYPAVKVSYDSRYEVAFAPSLLDEHRDFLSGKDSWKSFLEKYPHDGLLIPLGVPVVAKLEKHQLWRRVYHDGRFVLFVRSTSPLPPTDGTGKIPADSFP